MGYKTNMHYLWSTYYVQLCTQCFSNVNFRLKGLDYIWQITGSRGPSHWVPIPKIRQNVCSITSLTCPWPTSEDLLEWVVLFLFLWLNMQLLSGNAIVIWKYEDFNFACHCTKRIRGLISLPLEADNSDVVRCIHWHHIKVTSLIYDWAAKC